MEYRSGSQIREDFLRFFEGKLSAAGTGHRRVHSSSLVPQNDPTLLFTNAGMNQFKDVFLGAERRDYTRATSSQKCVRAGGKHNDLENVGFTRRHHTFFEMLGNFSFGDYFKKDAIAYAWELLTSPEWFGIDPARLYVTIFAGDAGAGGGGTPVPRDDEAERFWMEAGVPRGRIFAMGAKDNFWAMGDTGPCGPCSEIYYNLGVGASETGNDLPFPEDEQRYVEIWNLVFMQFDRASDGTLTPLPKPSIDTGMGLERIAAVLQGKISNFETDLFAPLIARAAELTWVGGGEVPQLSFDPSQIEKLAISDGKGVPSLRIIADHARCATFLISDGVLPSNEGRGYVLRKILRRGIRHGRLLGREKPFMHEMVFAVRDEMLAAYPELKDSAERVSKVVLAEEHQFVRVIEVGSRRLDQSIETARRTALENAFNAVASYLHELRDPIALSGAIDFYLRATQNSWFNDEQSFQRALNSIDLQSTPELTTLFRMHLLKPSLSGSEAFHLYETFGLPRDFIEDSCRDANVVFDGAGFDSSKLLEQQRARVSWKGGSQKSTAPAYRELAKTQFEGYSALKVEGARVLALVKDGAGVQELRAGESGEVVLDATSFYADSGGQVGDVGWLYSTDHTTVVAEVSGCRKPVQGVFAHQVTAKETIAPGDTLDTVVNAEVRAATMRNHTGTHLLHVALRRVLGTHVKQAGSLVDPQRLRFDFSHFAGVAEEELAEVEDIVNREVLANTTVETLVDVPIDVAVNELGAMALFGEKYGDLVRVVKIGDFSTELCGGTHIGATGEIGLLKLVGEGSVSSGVRRVEAVTGTGSLREFRRDFDVARVAGQMAGVAELSPESLRQKMAAQEEEMKRLRRELDQALRKSASASMGDAAAIEVKGVKVLARRVDGLGRDAMRDLVDQMRGKLGSGVIVLGGAVSADGKGSLRVSLIVGVTRDLTAKVQAGKVVGALAALVGGKGGGRPDLAEAGGSDVAALDGALAKAAGIVSGLL